MTILSSDEPRPAGCVTFPVSSQAAVFLHVRGRVDMDAEVEKARKKLHQARADADRQKKMIEDPKYVSKVATETKEADLKRLADLESKAAGFEGTIKQFEELKLEEGNGSVRPCLKTSRVEFAWCGASVLGAC